MKKLITILLTFCIFSLVSSKSLAIDKSSSKTEGNYEYVILEDGTVEISKYLGEEAIVSIPTELNQIKVTSIGEGAFEQCDSITTITIPDGIISIGDWAFSRCANLEKITISDSVTTVEDYNPFYKCLKLTNIEITPDHPTLATIDGILFSKPDKRLICYPCALLQKTYNIPKGIQIIGDYSFYKCENVNNIIIPDSVTTIGLFAFGECDNLTGIDIPDSVTIIKDSAFYKCSNLSSVSIPINIVSISRGMFMYCSSLTSILIPDGVSTIDNSAFKHCSSLINISLPESLSTIGRAAFSDCTNLSDITIPKNVTFIGIEAFSGCEALTSVIVERESYAREYCVENNLKFTYIDANDWLLN